MVITEHQHVVQVLNPVEENPGTTATSVINLEGHHKCSFFIIKGAGAAGQATVTVVACDDTTPNNTTAIAFKYRRATSDTWGTLTDATTAGFETTAAANDMYEIVVDPAVVGNAVVDGTRGHNYVQIVLTNTTAQNCVYGIHALLSQPRYPQAVQSTVLT